jgi:predicted nucleotidyltransferase
MNAPDINRSTPRMQVAAVEQKHPIKRLGLLLRGSATPVFDQDGLDFRVENKPGLDLLGLSQAEVDLSELLGRAVGIVLASGLKGREAAECPCIVAPA